MRYATLHGYEVEMLHDKTRKVLTHNQVLPAEPKEGDAALVLRGRHKGSRGRVVAVHPHVAVVDVGDARIYVGLAACGVMSG